MTKSLPFPTTTRVSASQERPRGREGRAGWPGYPRRMTGCPRENPAREVPVRRCVAPGPR